MPQAAVKVVAGDLLAVALPDRPFQVVASPPFGLTSALLRRLLDDPRSGLERADLVLQWEVARKRAAHPPTTALSTGWAPWWETTLVRRIPRRSFRPVPSVDAGWLVVVRRRPPLLPDDLATDFAGFVRSRWWR